MSNCKCVCHSGQQAQHIIPCCSKALKLTKPMIREFIESSIDDAISSKKLEDEALRQKIIQKSVEEKLKASTHSGDEKSTGLDEDDPMNTGAPKRAQPTGVPPTPTPQTVQQQQAPQVIDADAIIDKLNIIRSGKSLNDKDIRDAAKAFLASMGPQQLKALFGVLQQMGRIVQPAVEPRVQAPPEEPSAVRDARLQMLKQKAGDAQNIPQNPQPQQKQQPNNRVTNRDDVEEDDSPPIKVGMKTSEAVRRNMKLLLQK